jgi:hypothetical protein
LIVLGFVFFKPPLNYFAVMCLSTIMVWAAVFSFRRRPRAVIVAGVLLQIIIQQAAYHAWLSAQTSMWWPLAQFLSLQYVVALRLGSSRDDTPGRRNL